VVEIHPPERPDGFEPRERPLLSAHPWRLPVLLAIAFAATVAITAAVVRSAPGRAPVSHASKR